jgi:hypothetical protein
MYVTCEGVAGRMMKLRDERGATLVLVIGAVAALAILAAAMVALLANVQHNTATHRTQSKAFNVAEAGLDAGQAALWVNWPDPEDQAAGTLPSVDAAAFRAQFVATEFPDPVTGQFIGVEFYDDDGNTTNPGIEKPKKNYDANRNDYMWIVSRGATGTRAAKVQALVKKMTFDMLIKEGVALYTDGTLDTRGTGHQPVVGLDPPATFASVYAGNVQTSGQADIEAGISVNPDADTTLSDVFPDDTLAYLIDAADGAGKYYQTQADIPPEAWSEGLRVIVIDHGGVDLKDVPDTDTDASGNPTVWSEDEPGVLIVLDGDMTNIGQKKSLYGVVYLMDGVWIEGNAEIHGMCIAAGSADLRGTRAANYNAEVLANLNRPQVISVRLVPNTWREIHP